jgi:hypothetical protein
VGAKEVFNHAHSSLWNVIKRSSGVLKMNLMGLLPKFTIPMIWQAMILASIWSLA